jgi:hypothetical protein
MIDEMLFGNGAALVAAFALCSMGRHAATKANAARAALPFRMSQYYHQSQ